MNPKTEKFQIKLVLSLLTTRALGPSFIAISILSCFTIVLKLQVALKALLACSVGCRSINTFYFISPKLYCTNKNTVYYFYIYSKAFGPLKLIKD
jgi:hypothetical protein